MIENWADVVADRMVGTRPLRKSRPGARDARRRRYGTLLLLGAADTGKTTLMSALAERLAQRQPVALVDADTGQSHIGPPTTVGWTVHETRMTPESVVGRIAGLTDAAGQDMAIGVIKDWQQGKAKMTVRAPLLDLGRVRCLTVGNTRIDIPFGWS
jgi:polynucleotide 5'-kinase involved in rRNA processing